MSDPKVNYLAQCTAKVVAFANPKVETATEVERLVNLILEADIHLRREVLGTRNPLNALRMAMTRAQMVHYLYVDPLTNRSALLFGRRAYVKTPQQFVDWIENHASIRQKVQAHTR